MRVPHDHFLCGSRCGTLLVLSHRILANTVAGSVKSQCYFRVHSVLKYHSPLIVDSLPFGDAYFVGLLIHWCGQRPHTQDTEAASTIVPQAGACSTLRPCSARMRVCVCACVSVCVSVSITSVAHATANVVQRALVLGRRVKSSGGCAYVKGRYGGESFCRRKSVTFPDPPPFANPLTPLTRLTRSLSLSP